MLYSIIARMLVSEVQVVANLLSKVSLKYVLIDFWHSSIVFVLGGPLHEGDIEELPSRNGYCIKCPWHSWKFDISTGQCVSPQNRYSRFLKTYPVKFDCKGKISVGFASIDPALFSTPPE